LSSKPTAAKILHREIDGAKADEKEKGKNHPFLYPHTNQPMNNQTATPVIVSNQMTGGNNLISSTSIFFLRFGG
jgi:hypothetical protein